METKKFFIVRSNFGHEILTLLAAKSYNKKVVIIPKAENENEFNSKSLAIFHQLKFFYKKIRMINWEEREKYEAEGFDFVAALTSKQIPDEEWKRFAKFKLEPTYEVSTEYHVGGDYGFFIPQKLISDGKCGVTAEQQSIQPEMLDFLKKRSEKLVLMQHFSKTADVEKVLALGADYVPGQTENPDVFGIRGVLHSLYYQLYRDTKFSVGIAGTHTWYLLCMFPEVPQVILYRKDGKEHWPAIQDAWRAQGYNITCLGFDDATDMKAFEKEIQEACKAF